MIIHQPELIKKDDHTIVFAKIELEKERENFPQYMWYRVQDKHAKYLSLQSDAYLVPALWAAMHFGEDIEIRGTVSPRLAYQLDEYQFLLNFRMPDLLRPVDVKYAELKPFAGKPHAVGASFSGGVDSLFTLWKHLPQNQPIPNYQITHELFVLGFNIVLKGRSRYQSMYSRYSNLLKELDIELVSLETNAVSLIVPRLTIFNSYGPILAGAAHILGGLFERYLIPSSYDYWKLQVKASSSDALIDPFLSSDTLDILNHGVTYRRVDKIEEICDWELAQKNLRICTLGYEGLTLNCSRCEKCVRTMVPLYALGKLEKFTTFKKPLKANRDLLWRGKGFDPSYDLVPELIPYLKQRRKDLIPWFKMGTLLGSIRYWSLKLIPGFVKKMLRKFGHFVDPLKETNAFEDPEIIQMIHSQR